ncbi:MAG: hypothetical protein ACYTGE_18240 [Planctomycetota bacterium]
MPGSRIGHTSRRHPLCPHCGYDVVATVAERGRACPECGGELDPSELRRAALPGDWTPARGLRRLVIVVAARAAVCLVAWTAVLVLCPLLCGWLSTAAPGAVHFVVRLACGALALLGGAVIGAVVGRRMDEVAGFRLPLLPLVPVIGAAVAILGGAALATIMGHTALCDPRLLGVACCLATVWIVYVYVWGEY